MEFFKLSTTEIAGLIFDHVHPAELANVIVGFENAIETIDKYKEKPKKEFLSPRHRSKVVRQKRVEQFEEFFGWLSLIVAELHQQYNEQ